MGALLSICFKSGGDETQARSKCQQQRRKKKLTKQKSMVGGPPKMGLLGDSGRSSSSGYSSTETGPPPTALDRRPESWGRPLSSPGDMPQPPRPMHPKGAGGRDSCGPQRTLSFNLSGLPPESSPSQRRRTFKKSGRKK